MHKENIVMAYLSNKKIDKIYKEIYKRWYAEAVPHADYDELLESAYNVRSEYSDLPGDSETKKIVFEAYFIDQKRLVEIVHEVLKEYKVPESKEGLFGWIYLGHGPMSFSAIELFNEENQAKFKELIRKVDAGELITYDDLNFWEYEVKDSKDEISNVNLMRLYEYNRKSHPEEAKKYFEMLKNKP